MEGQRATKNEKFLKNDVRSSLNGVTPFLLSHAVDGKCPLSHDFDVQESESREY